MDQNTLVLILAAVLSGAIGLAIGKRKKREAAGFILGALLGPIGWLLVGLGPNQGKKCPDCLAPVEDAARKCRHCGSELVKAPEPAPTAAQ